MSSIRLKDHIRAVTGVLTIISLALVFSAALGVVPRALLPRAPVWFLKSIPLINAVISLVALIAISLGWYWIRNGRIKHHRAAMMSGLALFALFLVLYLYKVSLQGPTPFTGPAVIRQFVYLPLLAIHILLAMVCIPLLYYVVLLAVSRPVSEIPSTNHAQIGRIAASLWVVSFLLGIVVYLLLYVIW